MLSLRIAPRKHRVIASLLMASMALATAACGGDDGTADGKKVIKVAYGSDYVFLKPELAEAWWKKVATEFEAKNPDVTVEFIPIPGGLNDIITKLSLLYRSPKTAPDVAEMPSDQLGDWVASGYLREIDGYVADTEWWSRFPDSVKAETTVDGHVYGVNHGENTNAIYYNIPMFEKAGISVPWQPKTWADVTAAARAVRASNAEVWPTFLVGGTAGGSGAMQYSGGNLLMGSSDSTIFDKEAKKWVVDSAGIRETLGFYSDLAKNDLQAPASELLDPNAIVNTFQMGADQQAAIIVSGNFLGSTWTKEVCAPCFPEASETYGVTPVPTVNGTGQPNVGSVLGGWDLTVGAASENPDLAFDFINTAQSGENMITAAKQAGWVPPDQQHWSEPEFADFAPPYQKFFAELLPASKSFPNGSDFAVWATGFGMATGEIIKSPSTSVDKAVDIMKEYVTGQLGADKVVTRQ